jgi:multidrug efflux pump subunit AcrB
VTVGTSLLTSLALALTWTPTLSHYFIRQRSGRSPRDQHSAPPFLMNAYARVLKITLEHRFVLAAFSLVLVAGAYLCYTHTGSDLLPAMDEGGFIVDYIMPAGSSLAETNRVITHVEKILRATPEVENTSRRTGLQLGLAQVTEANTGDISVKLKADRKRSGEEVIADVRAKVREQEPVLDVEFPQLLQDMIGDLTSAPEPVVIKLFSQDPALLEKWAVSVGDTIKKIPKVVDELNGIEICEHRDPLRVTEGYSDLLRLTRQVLQVAELLP